MRKFAKYDLKQVSKDKTYTRYEIKDLKKAYYKSEIKNSAPFLISDL